MKIENTSHRTYIYDETNPEYSGQNSKVYYAFDELFNRKVCLKVISYDDSVNREKEKLLSEVIALSKAGGVCSNIPMIFDYWFDDNKKLFYIVMQLISGESLRTKLSYATKRNFHLWMLSLCETLSSLHYEHIVHKDIKPENIIITKDNQLYLIDFNISINNANLIEGTEYYRAPEMKHEGISVSRSQVDIFSVGVMMYEFYTGQRPAEGVNYGTKRFQTDRKNWGFFAEPDTICKNMPKRLNDIITKCMQRDPQMRYKKVSELKSELKSISGEINKWRD